MKSVNIYFVNFKYFLEFIAFIIYTCTVFLKLYFHFFIFKFKMKIKYTIFSSFVLRFYIFMFQDYTLLAHFADRNEVNTPTAEQGKLICSAN